MPYIYFLDSSLLFPAAKELFKKSVNGDEVRPIAKSYTPRF